MKKVILLAATASILFAGADIEPLVDYEVQDVQEAKVEEVKQVAPAPVPVPVVVAPAPVPVVPPVIGPKNMYVGLDALCGRFETSSGACSCLGALTAKIGYEFNKYIAVEGRVGHGLTAADHDGGGESEMKENYGLYLKPQLPLSESISLFGLAGYAKAKVESTSSGTTGLTGVLNEASPSFGLGLEYDVSDSWSVVVEAVRLLHSVEGTYLNGSGATVEEDDLNLDTFGFGVNYRF